jgi:hypothetical protein
MKSVTSNIGKAGAGPWATSRFQAHVLTAQFSQSACFDLESIIEDAWRWESSPRTH